MAKFSGLRDPVTFDFENSTVAYCVDALSISIGALMGTSPVTAFIESATGISGASMSPFLYVIYYICTDRGWKDRNHCYGYRPRVLHFYILRSRIRIDSTLGYRGCLGHCWLAYDPKVSTASGSFATSLTFYVKYF
jgi:hypothetical protein